MRAEDLQKKVYSLDYSDARVMEVTSQYFGDELIIRFGDCNNDRKIDESYFFSGCRSINLRNEDIGEAGPLRNYDFRRLAFIGQDINVREVTYQTEYLIKREQLEKEIYAVNFYEFDMNITALHITIVCKGIRVEDENGKVLLEAEVDRL